MSPFKTSNGARQSPSPVIQSRNDRPIKTSRSTASPHRTSDRTTPRFRRHPIRPGRRVRGPFPSSSRLSSRYYAERASPGPLFRLTGRQAVAAAAAYRRGAALAYRDRGGSGSSVPPSAPARSAAMPPSLVLPDRSRSIRAATTTSPRRTEEGVEVEGEDNDDEEDDDAGLQTGDGGVDDRCTSTTRMLDGYGGSGMLMRDEKEDMREWRKRKWLLGRDNGDVEFSPGSGDSKDVGAHIDWKGCDGVGMDIPCLRGFCSRRP